MSLHTSEGSLDLLRAVRREDGACGALGSMRHRVEGRQASHIPVKQSGRWLSILSHQDVGNSSAKVCASSS